MFIAKLCQISVFMKPRLTKQAYETVPHFPICQPCFIIVYFPFLQSWSCPVSKSCPFLHVTSANSVIRNIFCPHAWKVSLTPHSRFPHRSLLWFASWLGETQRRNICEDNFYKFIVHWWLSHTEFGGQVLRLARYHVICFDHHFIWTIVWCHQAWLFCISILVSKPFFILFSWHDISDCFQ